MLLQILVKTDRKISVLENQMAQYYRSYSGSYGYTSEKVSQPVASDAGQRTTFSAPYGDSPKYTVDGYDSPTRVEHEDYGPPEIGELFDKIQIEASRPKFGYDRPQKIDEQLLNGPNEGGRHKFSPLSNTYGRRMPDSGGNHSTYTSYGGNTKPVAVTKWKPNFTSGGYGKIPTTDDYYHKSERSPDRTMSKTVGYRQPNHTMRVAPLDSSTNKESRYWGGNSNIMLKENSDDYYQRTASIDGSPKPKHSMWSPHPYGSNKGNTDYYQHQRNERIPGPTMITTGGSPKASMGWNGSDKDNSDDYYHHQRHEPMIKNGGYSQPNNQETHHKDSNMIKTGGFTRPTHGSRNTPLAKSTSDIATALHYLKQAGNPRSPSQSSNTSYQSRDSISPRQMRHGYDYTIDRYENVSVSAYETEDYGPTLNSEEAARKHGGALILT